MYLFSFVTSTFMVEAMSVANAVEKQNKINRVSSNCLFYLMHHSFLVSYDKSVPGHL